MPEEAAVSLAPVVQKREDTFHAHGIRISVTFFLL
jgi:hypothetical protein